MPRLPVVLASLCLVAALVPPAAAEPIRSDPPTVAPHDADTVIVRYRTGLSAATKRRLRRRAGVLRTEATIPRLGARVVAVSGDPVAAAATLDRSRGVVYAEPNWIMHATATPDDPLLPRLYGLERIAGPAGWTAAGLGAYPATGGALVGIVDTGIDAAHPDLAGKVVACASATGRGGGDLGTGCEDDNGHGTHVSGTIAAIADNGLGVAGVSFASPLAMCRALGGEEGSGTVAGVASCIRWAHDRGARVISLSLGGPSSTTLDRAIRYAWAGGTRKGSVIVAAAGNDGDGTVEYPAGYASVVSVAATDRSDEPASFSNANDDVEVAAPGVDILSTAPGGKYVSLSGTSMATPHVAGAAALLWGLHPRATAAGIRSRLDEATADLGPPGRDPAYGFGRLDLASIEPRG